jgi:hypothetical protein
MAQAPIPFILEKDGKFEVAPEAVSMLQSISDPVAVVCVAGMQRTGKSFLLNQLSQQQRTFDVGNKIHACTKGVLKAVRCLTPPPPAGMWLWGEPRPKGSDPFRTLYVDTEGLASVRRRGGGG